MKEQYIAISEYLKNNKKLQELNISCNKISCSGIIKIGIALETNKTLQTIDISCNEISYCQAVSSHQWMCQEQ